VIANNRSDSSAYSLWLKQEAQRLQQQKDQWQQDYNDLMQAILNGQPCDTVKLIRLIKPPPQTTTTTAPPIIKIVVKEIKVKDEGAFQMKEQEFESMPDGIG
jgi:hypothetical protein